MTYVHQFRFFLEFFNEKNPNSIYIRLIRPRAAIQERLSRKWIISLPVWTPRSHGPPLKWIQLIILNADRNKPDTFAPQFRVQYFIKMTEREKQTPVNTLYSITNWDDNILHEQCTHCYCPACRTTFIATRFRVAVICPIIPVPHCIRVFFYFVWFVFINHIFQFYYELCTYCYILDIYLS